MSFKSAADDLCITPSAVSHQIKTLEEQLGVALFERRTRSVSLTPTGSSLFSRVDPLLRDLERVTSAYTGRRRRRVLRVTLLPFFASELFIPHLHKFSSEQMSIDLRLDGNDTREGARTAAADASILLLPSPPAGVHSYPLFKLRLVPACSPAVAQRFSNATAEGLRKETLIVHKARPNAWNDWLAAEGMLQGGDDRLIYLDSMYAVARAAERGLGIALVPVQLSGAWFGRKALVKPFDRELETGDSYYFIHRREDASDCDVLALRDWVIATFGPNATDSSIGSK